MPTVQEFECGLKCRSKKHVLDLISSITKGTLEEVQAYARLCHTAGQYTDTFGRTALHVATACGKFDIVEWLVLDKNVDLSVKDKESGWTALHRALFYGQLESARYLIHCNNDIYVQDNEGLSPLDLCMLERPQHVTFSDTDRNEIFSWGDNTNFTLGHSTELAKAFPEAVEVFRKSSTSIRNVVMCKYHTVFLTKSGQVYTCGHGHGGRLGHGDEQTCLVPKLVSEFSSQECVAIAASRDHSVFLLKDGTPYSCGLNDSHQLAQFPTPDKSLVPKPINHKAFKGISFKGICAGRFHTVLYTKRQVYTFGLNAGQLGHPKGTEKQSQPRLVTALELKDTDIDSVTCSDAATVCLTTNGEIYVLHEYQCRRITSRSVDIQKLRVVGGNLDHSQDLDVLRERGGYELIIAVLTKNGKIFMWKESVPHLKRCSWSVRRQLVVTDFALSSTLTSVILAFITNRGEGFIGQMSLKPGQQARKEEAQINKQEQASFDIRLLDLLLKDETESLEIRRIPSVHRGTRVFSDSKGRNHAVLQSLANECMTDVPVVSQSEMRRDFQQLLDEADEYDLIHDVIIEIGDHSWPAHLYILLSRSDYFHKLVADARKASTEERPTLKIPDVHPAIFEQLLSYIYTDTCDLVTVGREFELSAQNDPHSVEDGDLSEQQWMQVKSKSAYEVTQSQKKEGKEGRAKKGEKREGNPLEMLKDAARKFGIKSLARKLDTVKFVNGKVEATNKIMQRTTLKFDRRKLKDLHDVSIESTDEVIIHCHKCVLVARLEYFHSMLATGWMETSNSQALKLPVPGDILEVLITYLYTDDATDVLESGNVELLCNVLVVADQMLVTRLKEMCETAITCLITLKNVGELLEFSSVYNAEQLHTACQQYIHINMSALMEGRLLDVLSSEVINSLTSYYQEKVPGMCRRKITPYPDGPSKEFLESLVSNSPKADTTGAEGQSKKSKSKKRRSRQKSLSEEADKMADGQNGRKERQVSVSSVTSAVSEDGEDLPLISPQGLQIQTSAPISIPGLTQISPSARAGSTPWGISTASSPPTPGWVSGGLVSPPTPSLPVGSPTSPTAGSVDLRQIMMEENKKQGKQDQKKVPKNVKFSWKDVKKQQQQQQQQKKEDEVIEHTKISIIPPKPSFSWGKPQQSAPVASLRDVMIQDKAKKEVSVSGHEKSVSQDTKAKTQSISWGLPTSRVQSNKKMSQDNASEAQSPPASTSHENPWKVVHPVSSPTEGSVSFTDIVEDERQKHQTFTRTTTKPLHLIQIEEQAIQELLKHYKADENDDELITVERVPQAMATPLWAAKQQTKQSIRD